MLPVRFKPPILTSEQKQTHTIGRAATWRVKKRVKANNDGKRDNTYATYLEII